MTYGRIRWSENAVLFFVKKWEGPPDIILADDRHSATPKTSMCRNSSPCHVNPYQISVGWGPNFGNIKEIVTYGHTEWRESQNASFFLKNWGRGTQNNTCGYHALVLKVDPCSLVQGRWLNYGKIKKLFCIRWRCNAVSVFEKKWGWGPKGILSDDMRLRHVDLGRFAIGSLASLRENQKTVFCNWSR